MSNVSGPVASGDMRLRDLHATFQKATEGEGHHKVETLAEADGVMFQCPKCAQGLETFDEDRGRGVRGAHYVLCWFRGRVSDDLTPGPGRWDASGTSLDDLTLSPSVHLSGASGCQWHGWVQSGTAKLG